MSKNRDFSPNSRNMEAESSFFISKARLAFTQIKQAFVEALILYLFNIECHIQIETHASGYTIDEILSQLTLDNLGQ